MENNREYELLSGKVHDIFCNLYCVEFDNEVNPDENFENILQFNNFCLFECITYTNLEGEEKAKILILSKESIETKYRCHYRFTYSLKDNIRLTVWDTIEQWGHFIKEKVDGLTEKEFRKLDCIHDGLNYMDFRDFVRVVEQAIACGPYSYGGYGCNEPGYFIKIKKEDV